MTDRPLHRHPAELDLEALRVAIAAERQWYLDAFRLAEIELSRFAPAPAALLAVRRRIAIIEETQGLAGRRLM